MSDLLITGATGLLVPYLVDACQDLGTLTTTSRTGGDVQCDLSAFEDVEALIAEVQPKIIIHTAALTDVDACERDQESAKRHNAHVVENLADLASKHEAKLVYLSTDQVYSGESDSNSESRPAHPINAYGKTKLEGEAFASKTQNHLIFRTNMFGPSRTPGRQSLSDFFIGKLKMGDELVLFNDMYFSPLHMKTLSQFVVEAIQKGLTGVYNLGSRNGLSKQAFCLSLAEHLGLEPVQYRSVSGRDIEGRAPRPSNLCLDVSRIETDLGMQMPTLNSEIRKLTI
ncbi:SDR family oxidoreductase [Magnetovibrio sp. PR-2]|uniref:SDR family oxidoreductase n=1 Tax=Magnetovibrio sp. PR-2 TaxID=3120356 RepID=UPI002FCDEFFC